MNEMSLTRACWIFEHIDLERIPAEEKGMAIYKVCKMPTHNSIRKDDMLKVIWWLLNQLFEIPENERGSGNG